MSAPPPSDGFILNDALRLAIAATNRGDYAAALKIFEPLYTGQKIDSATGLSYYALCLARSEHRYNLAVKLCQKAIEAQFYDANHYLNLVQVYQAAGSRRKAVETMENAMARLPRDESIKQMKVAMGYRSPPVITMLSRDSALNIWLGKWRHRRRMRPPRERSLIRTLAWAVPMTLAWIALIIWYLMRNS